MKSKIIILVLAIFIATSFLAGCGEKTSIKVPDQSIPFLTLTPENVNGKEIKKAYLNFWDLKKGKIIKTDKVVYSITNEDNPNLISSFDFAPGYAPLYWDSTDHIILSDVAKIQANVYRHTETLKLPEGLNCFQYGNCIIFGKDAEIVKITTTDKNECKYEIKVWNGSEYVDTGKEINFSAHRFSDKYGKEFHCNPAAISKYGNNLYILLSGPYSLQTGIRLCLCTEDLKDGSNKWANLYVGGSPSAPPCPRDIISVKDKFYLLNNEIISAKKDNKEITEFEKCIKKIKEKFLPAESETEVARWECPVGNYNNIVFVSFDISDTVKGNRKYVCAIESGKLLGVLYQMNDNNSPDGNCTIEVMNEDGKTVAKYSAEKGTQCVFPRTNGGI